MNTFFKNFFSVDKKSLHTWSFYRLSQLIEYKAKLAGIKAEYVNPAYTSQTCPKCSAKNKTQGRKYTCEYGFEKHRDLVSAMNIRYAPVVFGKSQPAQEPIWSVLGGAMRCPHLEGCSKQKWTANA